MASTAPPLTLTPTTQRSRDPDALIEYVTQIGGIAHRRGVRRRFTPGALTTAIRQERVITYGRSRLALPTTAADIRAAHRVGAVLSHRSAAASWGWDLLVTPDQPEVALPRSRHLQIAKPGCTVSRLRLAEGDIQDQATSPLRTVLDCAARLPLDEALAIADGALRSQLVQPQELRDAADQVRGTGAPACRRLADAADGRAESVLESAVRSCLLDIEGLSLDLQVKITGKGLVGTTEFEARVDMADQRLGIVIEADSFEHHGGSEGLKRDARRYNELVARGWLVVRVTYDHARYEPEWVREVVTAAVTHRSATRDMAHLASIA